MKKRVLAMLLTVGMAMSLAGCGKEPPAAEEGPGEPVTAPAPVQKEPEPYVPSGVNPLTGLPMEEEYEDCRPVAVMFNNLKAAQPQLGVSQADIIYEVPAEGGITRMLGIYQTLEGVETLGSIRSTRPYYLELALGHDALLVHAGGSPDAYDDIAAWGVDNMDGVNGGSDAEIFWRDPDRRKTAGYEHSMVTSGERVLGYAGRFRGEHKAGWQYPQTFTDAAPAAGETAEHIQLNYSYYKTGTFDYDAATGLYMAGQYGGDYIDGSTGEQVGVSNVLVLETAIYVISGDSEGRLGVKLTGEGKGTYFCGGRAVAIRWSKEGRNSPFRYALESGGDLALARGKSYVCVMSPKSSALSYT